MKIILGDMDFKVAGTANGVTALQMDIKIQGITEEIMEIALQQALQARHHILAEMNAVIAKAASDSVLNAPQYHTMKVDPDKIRDIIGKGGATIRSITEETGASIDIDDNGTVKIYASNGDGRWLLPTVFWLLRPKRKLALFTKAQWFVSWFRCVR